MGTSRFSWPMVVLMLGVIALGATVLVLDKPLGDLASLINFVFLAVVYGDLQQVKSNTNGNTHRLMSMVERSQAPTTATLGVDNGQSTEGATK